MTSISCAAATLGLYQSVTAITLNKINFVALTFICFFRYLSIEDLLTNSLYWL